MQLGPQILLAAGGQLLDLAELAAASGGSTQAHENLGDGAGVRCGDRSAKHTARRAPTCRGVARWRLRLATISNALDVTTAERARAPPQPLLMVAKCSVMIGGHQVSSRRLLGRSGPKSGSAGSRWRPQHTRKSRAARAMAPVLQDKPRHSTDLAELCSLIRLLWSDLFPFRL